MAGPIGFHDQILIHALVAENCATKGYKRRDFGTRGSFWSWRRHRSPVVVRPMRRTGVSDARGVRDASVDPASSCPGCRHREESMSDVSFQRGGARVVHGRRDSGMVDDKEERPVGRAHVFRLLGVAAFWLALGRFLPDLLWRALPRGMLDVLSLPTYGMLCQVVTTLLGMGAAWLALEEPRRALRLRRPCGWHLLVAVLVAPAVFVTASYVALKVAEPYLIAELAREGEGASRRNAGAFGRAITQAPLVVTLLW